MNERMDLLRASVRRAVKILATGKMEINPDSEEAFVFVAALAMERVPDCTVGEVREALRIEGDIYERVTEILNACAAGEAM
jgi:hypothetical protein